MKKITSQLTKNDIKNLRAGDRLLLSGVIYTARDQAHKRLVELIKVGKGVPIDLKEAIIYYCGPTPAPKGSVIGSCGPTTSARMDAFTPTLLKAGLKGMIGKGSRNIEVVNAIKRHKAIYFTTYAGCGALLAQFVRSSKVVAFGDLRPEAICRLEVEDFPLIVAIDSQGRNIFK